jgi:hypothetical protein
VSIIESLSTSSSWGRIYLRLRGNLSSVGMRFMRDENTNSLHANQLQ